MSEVLFVNACVRPESRTLELAQHLIEKINGNHHRVDLYDVKLSPLDAKGMERRHKAAEKGDFSSEEFNLAKQFASADVIASAEIGLFLKSIIFLFIGFLFLIIVRIAVALAIPFFTVLLL